MAFYAQSCSIFCFVSIQTILIFSVSSPGTESHSFPQNYTMIHWAGRIEKEIEQVLQHVSGAQQMRGIYNEKKGQFEVVKNSPMELVGKVAAEIQKLLMRKRKALESLISMEDGVAPDENEPLIDLFFQTRRSYPFPGLESFTSRAHSP
ncbi:hypothetical protein SKAU_G00108400 [Synaphobranchus kaupii]|uniref:Uncharacterized protein n=1 Tax=Synaphobranchus kaupii TaxID=118154 RepID=A0A9Q1G073_SYNKA|nr:hypothetical protein SKAU_G00108400 [Synaphobranchus kaupii]